MFVLQNATMSSTKILFVFVLLLLILPACSAEKQANGKETDKSSHILVEVMKAETTSRDISRRFSGYTHPWESHGIGFLVAGRVTSIRVKEGDYVKKGQLLATIDPEDYILVKKLAEAQIKAIEPNFKRVDTLVEKQALPESKLDVLRGQYEAALTQKNQASRQINYTKLHAPTNGVVHELRTSVGQVIGQGSPAVVLLELDRLKVKFGVSQKDLKYFKTGEKHKLEIPGIDRDVEGTIFHIDYVADPTTRTYNVIFDVPNPERIIRPSMMTHLTIVKETLTGIFVPIHSIMQDKSGDYMIMTLTDDNVINVKTIKIGKRIEETIEITDGLQNGDRLVVKGNNFATEGDKVVVK